MSYSAALHREQDLQQCLDLVRAGPGFHAYALSKAGELEDLHVGITQAVRDELGALLEDAERALKWFRQRGNGASA